MRPDELKNVSTEELAAELAKREKELCLVARVKESFGSPVGIWRVTTEGDCEGRSTDMLGIFEGHVVDIAAHLRKRTLYSLTFHPVNPAERKIEPIKKDCKATITLDIDSGTWPGTNSDMSNEEAAFAVNRWLCSQPTEFADLATVKESSYYAAVELNLIQKTNIVANREEDITAK